MKLSFTFLDFTMRETISDTANHKSRGRVMVYSYPRKKCTVWLMASFQGTACGFRL